MFRKMPGCSVSCRFVVNQTAKGFLEVSVLACRCINTNLSRFRCDMTRDIIAHMQNALAAVVCLLFMLYSVPHEYIKRKVDVRVTDKTIEIFYNHNRIASHRRLYGRKGQYSTVTEHMPTSHQQYLEWNGDRFRKWAERIGSSTHQVVDAILTSKRVEQQSYRSCMGLLKLADKYSADRLEAACRKALSFTATPSYKSIKNILDTGNDQAEVSDKGQTTGSHTESGKSSHALTRGADYYRR